MRATRETVKVPQALKSSILRLGGKNPYRAPLYRVVLAQDRMMPASAAWTVWAENTALDDRGGFGLEIIQEHLAEYRLIMSAACKYLPQHKMEDMAKKLGAELDDLMKQKLAATPIRVESGVKMCPIYPFDGWILEKWKPAESFGSQADWEQYKFNGENALGPFPRRGEYELVAGPTPYILTIREAENAIREDFRIIQSRPRSARERVAMLMQRYEQYQKQKARDRANTAEAFQKDGPIGSLRNRLSLGANRVLNGLAKNAGLGENYVS